MDEKDPGRTSVDSSPFQQSALFMRRRLRHTGSLSSADSKFNPGSRRASQYSPQALGSVQEQQDDNIIESLESGALYVNALTTTINHTVFPMAGKEGADALRQHIRNRLPPMLITDNYGNPKPLLDLPAQSLTSLQSKLWKELPRAQASMQSTSLNLESVTDDDITVSKCILNIAELLQSNHIFILTSGSEVKCAYPPCKQLHKHLNIPYQTHHVTIEPLIHWGTVTAVSKLKVPGDEILLFRRGGEKYSEWKPVIDRFGFLPANPISYCFECLVHVVVNRVKAWAIMDNLGVDVKLPEGNIQADTRGVKIPHQFEDGDGGGGQGIENLNLLQLDGANDHGDFAKQIHIWQDTAMGNTSEANSESSTPNITQTTTALPATMSINHILSEPLPTHPESNDQYSHQRESFQMPHPMELAYDSTLMRNQEPPQTQPSTFTPINRQLQLPRHEDQDTPLEDALATAEAPDTSLPTRHFGDTFESNTPNALSRLASNAILKTPTKPHLATHRPSLTLNTPSKRKGTASLQTPDPKRMKQAPRVFDVPIRTNNPDIILTTTLTETAESESTFDLPLPPIYNPSNLIPPSPYPNQIICTCRQPAHSPSPTTLTTPILPRFASTPVKIQQCSNQACVIRYYHYTCLTKSQKIASYSKKWACDVCKAEKHFAWLCEQAQKPQNVGGNKDAEEGHGTDTDIGQALKKLPFRDNEIIDWFAGVGASAGTSIQSRG